MDLKINQSCCNKQQNQNYLKHLNEIKNNSGTPLMALQYTQELYGFLSSENIQDIATVFKTTTSEVYSVATFYHQFTFQQKGKHQISICLGTACYVKGASLLLEKIKDYLKIDLNQTTPDGLFSLDSARCVGSCGIAPVLIVDNDVYGKVTPDEVENILKKYE